MRKPDFKNALSKALPSLICSILLVGCASVTSDPALKAVLSKKETSDVADRITNAKTAWLGKYLLEPAARKKAAEILSEEKLPKEWDALDYSTAASMTGDVVAGSVNSGLGNTLGAASLALGLLAGDGSESAVSGYLLPNQLGQIKISSPEDARAISIQMIKEKVVGVATNIGYTIECVHDCIGFNPVYLFTASPNRAAKYEYEPEKFSITVWLGEFEDASNTKNLDSLAAGFPVRWRTTGEHGAIIEFRDKLKFDEAGNLILLPPNKPGLSVRVNGWDNHVNTGFGRHIHRQIFDNQNHFMGNKTNNIFIYDKKAYFFTVNSIYNSFDRIIVN